MQRITVQLGARSYPVLVGSGILGDAGAWDSVLGSRSLIVTSEAVGARYLDTVRQALGAHPHSVTTLPDGERAKTLATVEAIVGDAVRAGLDRASTLVALGGGAVGDVAGLAAALYMRGIGVVHAPTTLLAQVDASVGGKTAVNHPMGKNLIGAFHQPRRVVADVATLDTLPDRELRSGIAEVIKYALLDGAELFGWLEAHIDDLPARDHAVLAETVMRCGTIKARIVAADEQERGERALLNLGHTFGHALETAYDGRLLHGEAVALGCVLAARLSTSLGWLAASDCARITALIERAGLPVAPPAPAPDPDLLLTLMRRDKKSAQQAVRLVLLRGIGAAELTADYPHAAMVLSLRDFTMAP